MADTARITFTRSAADRIAAVVREVEQGSRDQAALRFAKPVTTSSSGGGGGGFVRLGKTTALFEKNTVGTIHLYERCTPPDEQRNEEDYELNNVVNHWADIPSGSWVMVAQASNGYWYILTAECG